MRILTLSQEKKFKARTPYIKKVSYNVVMYSPRLAKRSIDVIKDRFSKGTREEKEQLIDMLNLAAAIAMNNAKNHKRYKRAQREDFFEVAVMYKALRRDLEHELKNTE